MTLITTRRFADARGWFSETWAEAKYAAMGIDVRFVQDNQSCSTHAGTIRGIHFQTAPHAQAKL
ncbi:MAG: dTDP-4-dehydrorhamnose 3,5-epimerase family protein, partial [Brevundimonas sp.]|uniref:dTDP-4-dehydrorhamnose 3,5-epimerase family protein n=1 Tax=Brevundimonas sp. TaxID=1871086 RepID=UPI0027343AC3